MMLQWQWPWAIAAAALLAAIAIGVAVAIAARRDASHDADGASDDAHAREAESLTRTWSLGEDLAGEQATRAWRAWRLLGRIGAGLLAALLIVGLVLMGRPSSVNVGDERSDSRDIVLCLDVSGSALPYDREVIATYLQLIDRFQGERIGLSIFNSTSRMVFPLTDDYDLVRSQLNDANDLLRGVQTQSDIDKMSDQDYQRVSDWLAGTQNRKQETSLIGDGLVSCAAMLPGFAASGDAARAQATNRSESIVLATDNVVSGSPTYTLAAALDLTSTAGISVDGLFSGPQQSIGDQATNEMKSLIESHGGVFLSQRNGETVETLVRQIEGRQAAQVEQQGRSSVTDAPGLPVLALCVLFAGYLAVVWRMRR